MSHPEQQIAEEAVVRHVTTGQALTHRLQQLADLTEKRLVELGPMRAWEGISAEEILFGGGH